MKRSTREVYECEICGQKSEDLATIQKCEGRCMAQPQFAVGDIVTIGAGYGWFDGDRRWVVNPDVKLGKKKKKHRHNCFDDCCTMAFYYVVTFIDRDDRDSHRIRYHLFTNAMSGNEGDRGGWTFDEGHVTPQKVKSPPTFVVEDSKSLLGQKARWLK